MLRGKELASPKQMDLGKDISNPLMAGRLPKTTFPTSSVSYALMASLTIRTLCIKQFWTTAKVKTINDEVRIQALIDEKRSIPIPTEPSTSKPHKKYKPKKQQPQAPKVHSPKPSPEHRLPLPSNDPLLGGEDSLKPKELMDLCTHLSNKVLELESEVMDIKSTYKERIEKLKGKVDMLEEENKVLKDLHSIHYKVNIDALVVKKEKSFKQGRIIANIDEDVEIILEEAQAKLYRIDLEHPEKVLSMQDVDDKDHANVEEVLEVVKATKLMTKVVTTAGATTTAEATKFSALKRRTGVVIQDLEETTSKVVVHLEVQSKDKGKGILIEESKSFKGQAEIEQDEAFARQLEVELNAYINWNAVMEEVKRSKRLNDAVMKYQALKRKPLTEAQARKNMIIYLKNMAEEVNEEVTVPEKEVKVEGHKKEGESLEKEITKKQMIDEETEELKSHLHIVTNDDDVYTEASPLASKILIVDYKIYFERNKPYFKIIRADGNHRLFLSFSTLLKNFDREDLESLWKLVKESVWRDQKGRYGLAKRYLLTHFTLEKMMSNVRLEVEEESEMSLELLRLVKRQLNEGYVPD
nr:hypothetical protein [Tanacetum cinerariifolium]